MMAQVRYTAPAARDYEDIWLHVADDSPEAADRLLEAIDAKVHDLACEPGMGRSRDDFLPGLRSFPVRKSYLIFYWPISGGIELLRVLHGSRMLHRSLFQEE